MLLDSIDEAVAIGRSADRPVHVSHLKAAGQDNWGRMGAALARLATARAEGVDVRQDVYPYTAGSTMLTAALPPWFQEGGGPAVLRRLDTPADVERLAVELASDHSSWENHIHGAGWEGIVIASSGSHEHDGRSLAEVADLLGKERVDTLVHILRTEQLQVSMIIHSMHEPDLVLALGDPATMIGSDGLPPGVGGKPHPRMYGTFPRVLARYAKDLGVLTQTDAVRRMTSLPAEAFGLGDRGLVAAGRAADLVAFDAVSVRDRATYEDSTRPPTGIAWVMVNGEVVVRDGHYLGHRAGRRLRPDRTT